MKNEFENNDPLNSPDFGLPQGYFQKSATSVFNKIEWLEEHKEFPHLAGLVKVNAFKIPEHYFENSEQFLELIDYPVLKVLAKENGFATPVNYFIEAEEKQLSELLVDFEPGLAGIPKQNNFKVTPDYFSNNARELENKIWKKETKVIALFNVRSWMAVAALLVIALGFWMYNSYFVPVEVKDCGTIACIDKADLLKVKNLENLENDELYELVNTKALEQKLDDDQPDKNRKNDSVVDDDYLLDEI